MGQLCSLCKGVLINHPSNHPEVSAGSWRPRVGQKHDNPKINLETNLPRNEEKEDLHN